MIDYPAINDSAVSFVESSAAQTLQFDTASYHSLFRAIFARVTLGWLPRELKVPDAADGRAEPKPVTLAALSDPTSPSTIISSASGRMISSGARARRNGSKGSGISVMNPMLSFASGFFVKATGLSARATPGPIEIHYRRL